MSKEVTHNGAPDRFVCCSGGMDSVALAHYLIENKWDSEYGAWNKRPVVVYLDTTIGLTSQRVYVMALADHYEWMLWSLRTHQNFDSHTEREGFYGPMQHDKIFNVLKGRQLGKLATVSGNPHFYFGTRRAESDNRADIEEVQYDENKRATVHNPLYDWSDGDVVEYIRTHDIPRNPNWDASMPTDCACGATASREELLELEAEGYEVFVEKLRNLERETDTQDRRETWAWGSLEANEQRNLDAQNDDSQVQLSDLLCGPNCSGKASALQNDDND